MVVSLADGGAPSERPLGARMQSRLGTFSRVFSGGLIERTGLRSAGSRRQVNPTGTGRSVVYLGPSVHPIDPVEHREPIRASGRIGVIDHKRQSPRAYDRVVPWRRVGAVGPQDRSEGCTYSIPPVTSPLSLPRLAHRTKEGNASIARVPGGSDAAQAARSGGPGRGRQGSRDSRAPTSTERLAATGQTAPLSTFRSGVARLSGTNIRLAR